MYAVDYLNRRQIGFEQMLHPPVSGASRRAHSVHAPGQTVAKSVLIRSREGFVLAVLPATCRIDLERLARALGERPEDVRLGTPGEIDHIFNDCEPGTFPPFGRLYGLRTVVDSALVTSGSIVFPANLRHIDLKMPFRVFEQLEEPLRAEFSEPIAPRLPRTSPQRRRRAS